MLIMAPAWTHLIRFVAVEDGHVHLGQLEDFSIDAGIASFEGKKIRARVILGSIFDGVVTDKILTVSQVCAAD